MYLFYVYEICRRTYIACRPHAVPWRHLSLTQTFSSSNSRASISSIIYVLIPQSRDLPLLRHGDPLDHLFLPSNIVHRIRCHNHFKPLLSTLSKTGILGCMRFLMSTFVMGFIFENPAFLR